MNARYIPWRFLILVCFFGLLSQTLKSCQCQLTLCDVVNEKNSDTNSLFDDIAHTTPEKERSQSYQVSIFPRVPASPRYLLKTEPLWKTQIRKKTTFLFLQIMPTKYESFFFFFFHYHWIQMDPKSNSGWTSQPAVSVCVALQKTDVNSQALFVQIYFCSNCK